MIQWVASNKPPIKRHFTGHIQYTHSSQYQIDINIDKSAEKKYDIQYFKVLWQNVKAIVWLNVDVLLWSEMPLVIIISLKCLNICFCFIMNSLMNLAAKSFYWCENIVLLPHSPFPENTDLTCEGSFRINCSTGTLKTAT